jgi:hypothetical protein
MYKVRAYSVASATSPFTSTTIVRRELGERDVQIEILFCGICHSDLHQARNEWKEVMPTVQPGKSRGESGVGGRSELLRRSKERHPCTNCTRMAACKKAMDRSDSGNN